MTDSARPALLSWSGGKDAAWALHAARARGDLNIIALITTLTEEFDRVSMQGIRREVLHAQASATGLPLFECWIPQACDNLVYETRFADALATAHAQTGVRDIAFGDLFLADIREWRVAQCAKAGFQAHFPLFGSDTHSLARDMIAAGMRANLCCVDTTQLDAGFAGRAFDLGLLATLPSEVDPCGEHGEFHTCVSAGPMFDRPIDLVKGETILRDGRFAYTDFALAEGR